MGHFLWKMWRYCDNWSQYTAWLAWNLSPNIGPNLHPPENSNRDFWKMGILIFKISLSNSKVNSFYYLTKSLFNIFGRKYFYKSLQENAWFSHGCLSCVLHISVPLLTNDHWPAKVICLFLALGPTLWNFDFRIKISLQTLSRFSHV